MLRDRDERDERRAVTIHGEDRVGHDEPTTTGRGGREQGIESSGVAVGIDVDAGSGEPAPVDDARVVQGIAEDVVARADQRGDRADVRLVAGDEQQRGLGALEARELGLDLGMQREVAGDESRRAGAASPARVCAWRAPGARGTRPGPGGGCARAEERALCGSPHRYMRRSGSHAEAARGRRRGARRGPAPGRARAGRRARSRRSAPVGHAGGAGPCQPRGLVVVDKARQRSAFVCQQCGHAAARWLGQCPGCAAWNTLVEEALPAPKARGARPVPSVAGGPRTLATVEASASLRRSTGLAELDRVLGGGLVQGSLVLVGGDPGIGKSTLALQACGALAGQGVPVLYVAGEESPEQVRLRADRLGIATDGVLVLAETSAEAVAEAIRETRPAAVVVDSIQTLATAALGSAPGSVGQVRESAALLVGCCKATGVACFLIGHVTKEGTLAGPRVLEHLVDTVLYFEGDGAHALRVLRAVKNRFGSTNEVAVFEMGERGLIEVANPSAAFLAERPVGAPGSAVFATLEGSRPVLVEVQALVSRSGLAMPRRTTIGLDGGRVALLLAVLEKRMRMPLHDQDVFLNVAGGLRIDEPAADLAVVAAVASSARGRPLPGDTVLWGEVGLTREVRSVGRAEARAREAGRQGFRRCVLPAGNVRGLRPADGLATTGVATLDALFEVLDLA